MNKEIISQEIPQSFQGILWSVNVANLDLERNKNYIIHQVLAYGTLEQIKWLFQIYGKETIKTVFLEGPQNVYSPAALYFIKEIILGLKNIPIEKERYVQNLLGRPYRCAKRGVSKT